MRRHGKRQGRGKKTSVIKRRNIEAGGKNSNGTRSSGSQAYIHSFLCKSGAERRDTLILQPQDVRWGNAEFSISNLLLGGILNHLHSPNRRLHVRNSFLPGNKMFGRFGLVFVWQTLDCLCQQKTGKKGGRSRNSSKQQPFVTVPNTTTATAINGISTNPRLISMNLFVYRLPRSPQTPRFFFFFSPHR